jgi:DNA-binding CsgD family transcriptional regulator
MLRQLAIIAYLQGDLDRAATLLEESLIHWQQVRAAHGPHWALCELGHVLLNRHDTGRAMGCFAESLELSRSTGDRRGIIRCLEGLAGAFVMARRGKVGPGPRDAARLLGSAAGLRAMNGLPVAPPERPTVDRAMADARASLGDDAYAAAWVEGQALPLSRSIDLALELAGRLQSTAPTPATVSATRLPTGDGPGRGAALTAREREVAILVGRGYSNRRIAEALVIAEKTAEVHARNIREKLGLSTRAQIAAWVVQHGLLPADA